MPPPSYRQGARYKYATERQITIRITNKWKARSLLSSSETVNVEQIDVGVVVTMDPDLAFMLLNESAGAIIR